jgi:ABC-2 type transport system permease protein
VNLLDQFYERALPKNKHKDIKKFEQFARFKPEIKFKYVYYWAKTNNPALYASYQGMTDEEIFKTLAEKLELNPKMFKSAEEAGIPEEIKRENHRFTRIIERGNGNKAVLRLFTDRGYEPKEEQIAAAMRRLSDGPIQMAFLTGHGEPSIYRIGERGMSNFSTATINEFTLVNNGFDLFEINLQEQRLDTAKVDILVLTQPRTAYSEEEMKQIKEYIAKGGNMLIACETGCQDYMNPLLEEFGVQFMPGRIMQSNPDYVSTLVLPRPTKQAAKQFSWFNWMNRWNYRAPMLNAVGIDLSQAESKGVETFVVFETDSTGYWNELTNIGYTETEAEFNPELGEVETAFVMAAQVSRKVGEKEQRLILTGDTDWLTNGERSANRSKINKNHEHLTEYSMQWLTYGKYPIIDNRPPELDRRYTVKTDCIPAVKGTFWFGIPLVMIICCIAIQIKRKRK